MFRCDHCHTEYGGIRGISADSCPRCRAKASAAIRQRPAARTGTATSWQSLQLAVSAGSLSR